jgi:hypothetical protein
MGVYIEHPEGLKVGEVIPGLSKKAFAITGFTGGYASYDLVNGFSGVILANPLSIEATENKILVNQVPEDNRYLLSKDGEPYPKGSVIISNYIQSEKKKNINIFNPDGSLIENRAYTNMLNTLKLQQLYTLLKLRLTKRVALALAESDILVDHINEEYSGGKKFVK